MEITRQVQTGLDWLSFSARLDHLPEVRAWVGEEGWARATAGENGYRKKEINKTTKILFDAPDRPDEIHVVLTGQSLEALRDRGEDDASILAAVDRWAWKVARLDLAIDARGDSASLLDHSRVEASFLGGDCATHMRNWGRQEKGRRGSPEETGRTFMMGSRVSETFVRLYDKAAQMSLPDAPWMRLEAELKDGRASAVFRALIARGMEAAAGIIDGLLSFKDPATSGNVTRRPRAAWWDDLLSRAVKIPLRVVAAEKTLERARSWILKCVAATAATVVEADGGDLGFIYEMIRVGIERQRSTHRAMLGRVGGAYYAGAT